MNDDSEPDGGGSPVGVRVKAGDGLYIPAGGLQIWAKEDGTLGFGASLALDPWLPDLNAESATPAEVLEAISRDGFLVSTICKRGSIYGCDKTQPVKALISHPEIRRLRHMAVHDGQRALGVLNLDKARGMFRHGDTQSVLLVDDVYEPTNQYNFIRGDAPLMDYLLEADRHPYRLVEVDGKLTVVDVEDLQKVPVRALLMMWFSYLESLLARRLCKEAPEFREVVGTSNPVEAEGLGSSGRGPELRIERYYFAQLLREARERGVVALRNDEVKFLGRYRNNIFHGPRWYITRRAEVASLVNCAKKVVSLARKLASE